MFLSPLSRLSQSIRLQSRRYTLTSLFIARLSSSMNWTTMDQSLVDCRQYKAGPTAEWKSVNSDRIDEPLALSVCVRSRISEKKKNVKCKSFSRIIFVKSGSIYVKLRPNDHRPITHIVKYMSPAEMFRLCDNMYCVIIWCGCISQQPPGRAPLALIF